jgi:hypothetical protein
MYVVNWASNCSTVEIYSRNGKSAVRLVDTDALEKSGHVLLFFSDIQVEFVCAETKFGSAKKDVNNNPSEPVYFSRRIALSSSNGSNNRLKVTGGENEDDVLL